MLSSMALTGIWQMCGRRDSVKGLKNTLHRTIGRNYFETKISVMEYASDWTKHRKSLAFTGHVIRSTTSSMPWSCEIIIGDGFHEFL